MLASFPCHCFRARLILDVQFHNHFSIIVARNDGSVKEFQIISKFRIRFSQFINVGPSKIGKEMLLLFLFFLLSLLLLLLLLQRTLQRFFVSLTEQWIHVRTSNACHSSLPVCGRKDQIRTSLRVLDLFERCIVHDSLKVTLTSPG